MDLTKQKCLPCEGGVPSLSASQIQINLSALKKRWQLRDGDKKIARDFKFKDFARAMEFVNSAAVLAQNEGHHPDIVIHDWNRVKIELWTHAAGGLTQNDFILAAKIEELE